MLGSISCARLLVGMCTWTSSEAHRDSVDLICDTRGQSSIRFLEIFRNEKAPCPIFYAFRSVKRNRVRSLHWPVAQTPTSQRRSRRTHLSSPSILSPAQINVRTRMWNIVLKINTFSIRVIDRFEYRSVSRLRDNGFTFVFVFLTRALPVGLFKVLVSCAWGR
jgi:hypothetical protein